MANNQFVGKMGFVIAASDSGINVTMNKAGDSIERFGKRSKRTTQSVNTDAKKMAKFGNQMQQFGFLVDDAFTGFTARGWSGMIQAAANNATMLAMQFGATAGFITVLVMGAAQLATKLWKANDPVEKLTQNLKVQRAELAKNIDQMRFQEEMRGQDVELGEFLKTNPQADAIESRIQETKKQQTKERYNLQEHGMKMAELNKEIEQRIQTQMEIGPKKVTTMTPTGGVMDIKIPLDERRRNAIKQLEENDKEYKDALERRDKLIQENKQTVGRLQKNDEEIKKLLDRKSKVSPQEQQDKRIEVLQQTQAKINAETEKIQQQMMDARQTMLDSGQSVQLVNDQQGGLELEITANTDDFDAKLQASVNKFQRMIMEADDIPDDAARGLQLQAILAQADNELTKMAEKAGSISVGLGSMRSVGASEAGSSQSFSLLNRAINSNRQDQQNIAHETRQVAARVADVNKSINDFKALIKTVR